jgi:hypothetical protein
VEARGQRRAGVDAGSLDLHRVSRTRRAAPVCGADRVEPNVEVTPGAITSPAEILAPVPREERSAMMNRIVGIGTLFVIAFVIMFGVVFKDMFVWMWNNPDKIW